MNRSAAKPRGNVVVQRVLEVTLEELGRVGLASLSLPRVAELAGINKTSLYRRWPSKQALVTAALALAVPGPSALPDHGDLQRDLLDLVAALASLLGSPAGKGVVRMAFAEEESEESRRLAQAMTAGPTRAGPRRVLERAVARGELRRDADLDLLLHTLAGAVLHRMFVERKAANARWAARLIGLLTNGCRG